VPGLGVCVVALPLVVARQTVPFVQALLANPPPHPLKVWFVCQDIVDAGTMLFVRVQDINMCLEASCSSCAYCVGC
jgi:hypothetical protein